MDRREFLSVIVGAAVVAWMPGIAFAQHATGNYNNLLILVELKGGNDGLNTVVPYADSEYYNLRPRIAIPRDQVLQLDSRSGLHPALQPLLALWQNRELAVVQGVGYPGANLSHFRSIEIWDTASRSSEYLPEGWLTRAFASSPVPKSYAADGIVVGSSEMGPLAGGGTRALVLTSIEQFLRQARLASGASGAQSRAQTHPQGRAGRGAGGVHPQRELCVSRRVSEPSIRQCTEDGCAGDREQGRRRGGQGLAHRFRYAQRPAGRASAPAKRAC